MQVQCTDLESGAGEAKATSVWSLVQTGNVVQVSAKVLMYDVWYKILRLQHLTFSQDGINSYKVPIIYG